jgi:hypothetical protein
MKPKTSRCPPVTDLIEEFRRRDGRRVIIHDPALASPFDLEKSIEERAADALETMVKVILDLEAKLDAIADAYRTLELREKVGGPEYGSLDIRDAEIDLAKAIKGDQK